MRLVKPLRLRAKFQIIARWLRSLRSKHAYVRVEFVLMVSPVCRCNASNVKFYAFQAVYFNFFPPSLLFTLTAGSFCNQTGLTAPFICNAGYYSATTGRSSQTAASAAFFCNTTGMTMQLPCTAGSYCPSTGMSAPTLCTAGSYCPAGVSVRTTCEQGRICPTTGLSNSTLTVAGTFANQTGQSAAFTCEVSNFCPTAGLSAQSTCTGSPLFFLDLLYSLLRGFPFISFSFVFFSRFRLLIRQFSSITPVLNLFRLFYHPLDFHSRRLLQSDGPHFRIHLPGRDLLPDFGPFIVSRLSRWIFVLANWY
jgi:hypothetical protein